MSEEPAIDTVRPLARLVPGSHPTGLWVDPVYRRLGYEHSLRDVWVRAALVPLLLQASVALQGSGHALLVWDGWRPPSLQRILYEQYRDEIARTAGAHARALDELVARFVTDPDQLDPPPPHSTGGAVDLTLCDPATGEPRDLGGEFDELTSRSEPSFYEGSSDPRAPTFDRLRRTLHDVMLGAGFVRIASEWWHFEHGTALWASTVDEPVMFGRTVGPEAA
jgi:D-alanyl-D-alanine dipeptidase